MCSGDEKGCIRSKYFKEIKNIHTSEQIKFEKHIPPKVTQEKNLSPLAQNFFPVQKEEGKPHIKKPIYEDEQTTPKQYCGQVYDDKHVWKDLELEFHDSLAEEKKKIDTLQNIPTIPKHNSTPFKRAKIY